MELNRLVQPLSIKESKKKDEKRSEMVKASSGALLSIDRSSLVDMVINNQEFIELIREGLITDPTFITRIQNNINIPPTNIQAIINGLVSNQTFIDLVSAKIPMPIEMGYVQGVFPVVSGIRNNVSSTTGWTFDLLIERRGNLMLVTVINGSIDLPLLFEQSDEAILRQLVFEVRAPPPFTIGDASGQTLVGCGSSFARRYSWKPIDIPLGPDGDVGVDVSNNLIGAKITSETVMGEPIPKLSIGVGRVDPNSSNQNRVLQFPTAINNNFVGGTWYSNVSICEGTTFTFYDPNPPDFSV